VAVDNQVFMKRGQCLLSLTPNFNVQLGRTSHKKHQNEGENSKIRPLFVGGFLVEFWVLIACA
jgi:hypothetical protein